MKTLNCKKIILFVLSVCLCMALLLSLLPGAFAAYNQPKTDDGSNAADGSNDVYVADNFTEVPSDWEQIPQSDVANTKRSFHNGEMMIGHTAKTSDAGKYYGSAYQIATGNTYSNFTFEMTFRYVSWVNEDRFFGVMFHTQESGGRLYGYMANYRVNGRNAVSCIPTGGAAAKDTENTTSSLRYINLSDKQLHTLKLEMYGSIVRYYIDDVPIIIAAAQRANNGNEYEWDTTLKDSLLNNSTTHLNDGGFALLINQGMLSIQSVSIKPYAESKQTPIQPEITEDNNVTSTYYDMSGNVINGPTVVCDITDAATLDSVCGEVRPSNAILRYVNGNVVGVEGETLGSFADVYQRLRGRVVPVVRVETQADAESFVDYMNNTLNILDISVLSSDPELVKSVRTACPKIRGMIYFSEITSLWEVVATTHSCLATVAVLPQSLCTVENVTYIQARFETVWAVADSYLSADIYDCINSGAYGVVSPYFRDVYDVLSTYAAGSITRTAMNVAHRGCSNLAYENSMSAVRLAIQNGATHLELDGILTKDGKIAISHDDSLVAITNGSGSIGNMTLAQIQQYNLTLRDAGGKTDQYLYDSNNNPIIEHMPSLDEVLEEIKGTGVILVFEIKTSNVAIVPALKTAINKYNIADQVVVICFDDSDQMFSAMRQQLPEIPTGFLQGLAGGEAWSIDTVDEILAELCSRNAALDKSYTHGGASTQLNRYLRDRGMVGWYWTAANEPDVDLVEKLGFLGITNNCAEVYNNRVRFVVGADNAVSALMVGDNVSVKVITYGGAENTVQGEVVYCKKSANGWKVIARIETEKGYYVYTQSFEVARLSVAE